MWKTLKLGQLCTIVGGDSIPSKTKKEIYTNVDGLPYIATKDVSLNGKIDFSNGVAIPDSSLSKFKISKSGSALICVEGGSAGRKIAFSERDCCYGNKLFSISPISKSTILPKFIFYYLKGEEFQKQFKMAHHGLIGGVSKLKMKEFYITFPDDIKKQSAIILKLDNSFSYIDKLSLTSKNQLNKIENLENKLRDNIFYNYETTKWDNLLLKDILIDRPRNGFSPPKDCQKKSGVPVLTLSSVTGNNFNPKKVIYTNFKLKKSANYWVNDGDLLITRSNTRKLVGHVAIARDIDEPTVYPDLIMKINGDNQIVSNLFLFHYLQVSPVRYYIMREAKGANPTMVKINQEIVKKIPIKVPTLDKQKETINHMSKIHKKIDIYRSLINKKIILLEDLKSKVLKDFLSNPEFV